MTQTTEEFSMPMDLTPEHAAPVIESPQPTEGYGQSQEEQAELPFSHVVLVQDIQDEECLVEPIEQGSTFEVVEFDADDSSVAIKPHGCKTVNGLYWLKSEEYEIHDPSQPLAGASETEGDTEPTETASVEAGEETADQPLTRSQQLRFQHHEQIIAKQRDVDLLLCVWEEAKEEASDAKKRYESAVDALQRLIRNPPGQLPLFTETEPTETASGEAGEETGESEVSQVKSDEPSASETVESQDPEAWRSTSLEELIVYGLSEAVIKKFAEGGIYTLGDASNFQMGERGRPLTDIKGIGQAKVDKFEEASMDWHRDHPLPTEATESVSPVQQEQETEPEAEPVENAESGLVLLTSLIDHEFTNLVCHRFASADIKTVEDAEYLLWNASVKNEIYARGKLEPGDTDILGRVIEGHKLREADNE